MRITPTALDGVRLIDVEPHVDERGFFARTWCARELAAAGLNAWGTARGWRARRFR